MNAVTIATAAHLAKLIEHLEDRNKHREAEPLARERDRLVAEILAPPAPQPVKGKR